MSAMCRSATIRARPRGRRAGFALPSAIFLMVILAALGAFIVRVNMLQTGSSVLDVLGVKAYQAAAAGTEWGAYQVLIPAAAVCLAQTDLTFPGTALAPFTSRVKCTLTTSTDELGVNVSVYQIMATACNQPPCPNPAPANANYVARQITVTLAR